MNGIHSLSDIFASNGFIPHGYCLTWSPTLLWLHVISDTLIVLSYYSIPITLAYFVRKRPDLPYKWMFVLFGLFISACGTTHLLAAITIWIPLYWLDGIVKAITAVVSVASAVLMLRVIPRALLLRSPALLEVEVQERKLAEMKANTLARRNHLLMNSTREGVHILDNQGRIVEVNEAFCQHLGYSRAELMELSVFDFDTKQTADEIRENIKKLLHGHAFIETVHKRKDGSLADVEIHISGVELEGNDYIFALSRDITERKRQETLLNFRLKLIDMTSHVDYMHLMQATLDKAEELTGSTIGFFHYVDDDQENISLQTWSTNTLENMCKAEGAGQHYPVSQAGVWADAIRTKTSIIQNDYPHQENKKGMPEGHAPIQRFVSIPVIRGDKIVAMIGVGNKPSDYVAADVEIATQLAEVVFDLIQANRTQQLLRDSEERFRKIAESAQDAIIIMDADKCIAAWNPAAERLFGYSAAEAIGKELHPLIAPQDAQLAFNHGFQHFLQTGTGPIIGKVTEIMALRKGGEAFPVEVSLSALQAGGHWHAIGIFRDITERKKREWQLVQMNLALNHVKEAAYLMNEDGNFLYVNEEACRVIGYTRDELLGGMGVTDIDPNATVEIYHQHWQAIKTSGTLTREAYHRTRDGNIFPIEICVNYFEYDGHGYNMALVRDITERKQAESELRIAAIAFESQEGMTVTDANGTILRVNKAFTEITGYTAGDVIGKNPRVLQSGRHDANFYEVMWKCITSTGAWEGEIWNRRKSGEIYPEHLTITAVKDMEGNASNYVATLTDITLSKAAEDEIKHLAFYDPLTRLPNRRLMLDRLHQALASSKRNTRKGALLFIDLDNFKTLNDTLGHDIGDLLLQQVADRLESCVREGDTVARLGGDEFVVILEDLSEQAIDAAMQTEAVGNKILATLNQPYQLAAHAYNNSPSIGITLFDNNHQAIEELLKQADIAMYQSKNAGRNTLRFFDPQMQ